MEQEPSQDIIPSAPVGVGPELRHETYEWLPIKAGEIRLAYLLPSAEPSAPLRVDLYRARLRDSPSYEALSYTWGTELSLEDLRIHFEDGAYNNEHLNSTVTDRSLASEVETKDVEKFHLTITRNLEAALRQLRKENVLRCLWVDSICIDQSQPLEKDHQVRRMARIFSQASRVLVWLGEATSLTDSVFDYLNVFNPSDCQKIITKPERSTCNAVNALFDRPWWKRRWVIQEALLARTDPLIICGHRCISMQNLVLHVWYWYGEANESDILLAFRYKELRSEDLPSYDPYEAAPKISARIRPYEPKWEAGDLLQFYELGSEYEALDPRDHIYSMLGLVEDWYQDRIPVDYQSPTSQVYQNATFAIIQRHNSLNVLKELTEDNTIVDLPSWTKDFSMLSWTTSWSRIPPTRTPRHIRNLLSLQNESRPRASGHVTSPFTHSAEQSVLSVSGLLVGSITLRLEAADNCFECCPSGEEIHSLPGDPQHYATYCGVSRARCDFLIEHANRNNLGVHPQVTMADVCALLVLGDTEEAQYPDFPTVANLLETVWQTSESNNQLDNSTLPSNDNEDESLTNYLDAVAGTSASCSPFVTDSGFIGLTSNRIQQFDIIAVLFGADLPAVLRPVSKGSRRGYEFVSFAYVHGVMHGESVGQGDGGSKFNAGDWESHVTVFDLV